MSQFSSEYNLEERTAVYSGELMNKFCRSVKEDNITRPLVNQLVRSGTSIGANYCEANNASSRKDFQNKIFICKKEAQETKYWLRTIATCCPEKTEELRKVMERNPRINPYFSKDC